MTNIGKSFGTTNVLHLLKTQKFGCANVFVNHLK